MLGKHREVIAGRHKGLGKVDRTAFDQLLRKLDAFGGQEFFQNRALPAAHHGTNPGGLRKVRPGLAPRSETGGVWGRKHTQPVAKDDALFEAVQKIVELRLRDDEIEVAAQEFKQKLHLNSFAHVGQLHPRQVKMGT